MTEARQVARRRVFYIPGYDPIHPRRYRELYRKEGAAQAAISGYDLALRPRKGPRYGWSVTATIEGARTETEVEVLVWSDIVRQSMKTGIAATYLQLLRTAWVYLRSGALRRLMWLRKGPIIAALYPVGMLLIQLALACGLGWMVHVALVWGGQTLLFPVLNPSSDVWRGAVVACLILSVLSGVAAAIGLLRWFRAKDGRFFAYYLMHDYAYSAQSRGANPPALETRMSGFADAIAAALNSDADEVLVVGHSSGAHLAVSVLADLIRAGRVPEGGPALAFLSLGQVIPMVSFLPEAYRLRADLRYLSQRSEVAWLDVTAPGDGCAFALCDPVAVSGVAPAGQRGPLVISAAFTQTLLPETWARLRWRFFRLHFQYLCAFDRPGDYDYFRITAGPATLAARFAGRAPSASRITIAASPHVSTGTGA
ncbi:hypothetical protein EKE94_02095 [Mesobaculum littorinae]|uniref:Uncharacterized protein n=1 Tax=Mesobaculum littorinae TaxID=2486419 RepID=A0A438ALM7_9RHOB|nr:hypothetical protein [Mesobaculum littorinae]RVV99497.1 hypothetical protein EKE94_02095 [Mesobaculum littorinae]